MLISLGLKDELSYNKLEQNKLENQLSKLQEEDENVVYEPLNKRVFEPLAAVGALKVFGLTRKSLIQNIENTLKMKPTIPIEEEYSTLEILELENKYLEYSITSPFSKQYIFEDSSDTKLVCYLSDELKRKRDGGEYKVVTLMDRQGVVYKLSDFNGRFDKFRFGNILEVTMSFGKYTNLVKVQKHKVEKVERGILKLKVLEDIPSDISAYKEVHVYDGSTIAMVLK